MSGARFADSGAGMSCDVRVAMYRWGGGAEQGKTHVYLPFAHWFWDNSCGISLQCVTDDFGNLVRVA